MYQPQSDQMSVFENEHLFQLQGLNPDNDWVRLAKLIPWAELERRYAQTFDSNLGNVGKPARMALGALIIKERYGFSDEDTVQEIRMIPYLQFFIGLPDFQHEAPFDQSTMTVFRKRIPVDLLADLNDFIAGRRNPYAMDSEDDDDDSGGQPPRMTGDGATAEESSEKDEADNRGTLILDATCVPQDIRFPTDLSLLNEARESLEGMIDSAFPKGQKPRTYRNVARRDYLRYVRNRRPSLKLLRKSLRKQLAYVLRNLAYLAEVKDRLSEKDLDRLGVIEQLHAQQKEMYEQGTKRVDDRIVSLHQPWVRPIVRGKAKAPVEFGEKIAVSLVNGYLSMEGLSWGAFHEGMTFQESVERYREDTGVYPKQALTDKAYRIRENLQYCKERGVRMSALSWADRPRTRPCIVDSCRKNVWNAASVVRWSQPIHTSILTMNLWRRLRGLLFALIQRVLRGIEIGDEWLVRNLFAALFTDTDKLIVRNKVSGYIRDELSKCVCFCTSRNWTAFIGLLKSER